MKRKKIVLIFIAMLVITGIGVSVYFNKAAYDRIEDTEQDGGHYTSQNTDDYSEIYADQLKIIFGEDYVIEGKETIVIEGEDCDCGYHSDDYKYDEWKISYQDRNGQKFTQTLNNKESLEAQQLTWLGNQLSQYYIQKYLIDFFEDGTFEDLSIGEDRGRTYCSVSIGHQVYSYTSDTTEEFKRVQKVGMEYREQLLKQLQDEENMLRLQEVDYEKIFNCYPIKVGFHLSIDDEKLTGKEKEEFEKGVQERVLEMIQLIKQETSDTCNLRIQVNSANGHCDLYDGSRDWRYFILQGEQIIPEDLFDGFEWQFFYAYEGIYW